MNGETRGQLPSVVGLWLVVACFAAPATAQQTPTGVHQWSAAPPDGRFEIVQSQLAAKWTFRLDRFSGRVALLVKTKDDGVSWEELRVFDRPSIPNPSRPRFQIFTSGIAARHTFLIDTDIGDTWMLITLKRRLDDGTQYEVHEWQPFEE